MKKIVLLAAAEESMDSFGCYEINSARSKRYGI